MNHIQPVLMLSGLPRGLQKDGVISIELNGGVPILRASRAAQDRIEDLLQKQKTASLTPDEEQELQQYEDVDDYLSYLNRLTRNLATTSPTRKRTVPRKVPPKMEKQTASAPNTRCQYRRSFKFEES